MKKRLFGILSALLLCLCLLPVTASAATVASGTCGGEGNGSNLTWVLTDNGTLTISGSGAMADWYSTSSPPWTPYTVNTAVIGDKVTSIGKYAFALYNSPVTVKIGAGVTYIDSDAFSNCQKLTGFTVSTSNPTYSSDASGVLFSKDKKTLLCYPAKKTQTTYTIPSSVIKIGSSAFEECDNLTSVTIGNNVTQIGHQAFGYCSKLTSVTIGSNVTSIDYAAFRNCTSLTGFTVSAANPKYCSDESGALFSKDKTVIYHYPAANARQSYSIPDTVTRIDMEAFSHNQNLVSVVIPDGVTSMGNCAFSACESLASITIGKGVTTISDHAFDACRKLKSVVIPGSVTTIDRGAFYWCSGLTSVEIGDGVTTIGSSAFSGCDSLKSVVIPNSVTAIKDSAFSSCDELYEVFFMGSAPTFGGNSVFYQVTATCYYPPNDSTWTSSVTQNYNGALTWRTWRCEELGIDHSPTVTSAVASTCTATGLTEGSHCRMCGTVLIAQQVVAPTNHANKHAGASKAATCITDGNTSGEYCPDCDTWLLPQEVIPASGHNYGNVSFLWATDLTKVDISAVCHCGEGIFQPCAITWDNTTPDKLIATATAQLGDETYSDSREIRAVVSNGIVVIILPTGISGINAIVATYDNDARMVECEIKEVDRETIIAPVGTGKIRIFFVDRHYCPIPPSMQLNLQTN